VEAQLLQDRLAAEAQEAERSLKDINAPRISYNFEGTIVQPGLPAGYKIPPHYVQLVGQDKFGGSALEDPYVHMDRFTMLVAPLESETINLDVVRLALFSYSVRDAAHEWLRSQPRQSITSWDDLAKKFAEKFFPDSRIRQLKDDILSFKQMDSENVYEVWERFKGLLRRCPGHNMTEAHKIDRFYASLNGYTKDKLNLAGKKGAFDHLPTSEALEIIENLAARTTPVDERLIRRNFSEVQAYEKVMASNKQLSDKMDAMCKRMDSCNMPTEEELFDEEVKFMRNSRYEPDRQEGSRRYFRQQRGMYREEMQQPPQDEKPEKKSM
jgi:hypothetical protein